MSTQIQISQVSQLVKELNNHILQINNIVKILNNVLLQFNEKIPFLTKETKKLLNTDMKINPLSVKVQQFNNLFINVGFKTSEGKINNYEVDYGTTIDSLLKQYTELTHLDEKKNNVSFYFNGIPLCYGDYAFVEEVFKNTQTPTIDVYISNFVDNLFNEI